MVVLATLCSTVEVGYARPTNCWKAWSWAKEAWAWSWAKEVWAGAWLHSCPDQNCFLEDALGRTCVEIHGCSVTPAIPGKKMWQTLSLNPGAALTYPYIGTFHSPYPALADLWAHFFWAPLMSYYKMSWSSHGIVRAWRHGTGITL